ncbi:MAG: hypothetical protein N7Q72_06980 [Spiroplasma sp. Tabriz.8]|nr:hypothetical protein [Candidatus Regiella insecticola]MCZ8632990.1 hypothetical protein [Spiroplasma sp. Tabriz.8]
MNQSLRNWVLLFIIIIIIIIIIKSFFSLEIVFYSLKKKNKL